MDLFRILFFIKRTIFDKTFLGNNFRISISNSFFFFIDGYSPLVIRNIENQFSINKSNIFKLLIIVQTSIVFLTYLLIANNNSFNKIYILFALPMIIGNYYCLKIRAGDKLEFMHYKLFAFHTQGLLLIFYINVWN